MMQILSLLSLVPLFPLRNLPASITSNFQLQPKLQNQAKNFPIPESNTNHLPLAIAYALSNALYTNNQDTLRSSNSDLTLHCVVLQLHLSFGGTKTELEKNGKSGTDIRIARTLALTFSSIVVVTRALVSIRSNKLLALSFSFLVAIHLSLIVVRMNECYEMFTRCSCSSFGRHTK